MQLASFVTESCNWHSQNLLVMVSWVLYPDRSSWSVSYIFIFTPCKSALAWILFLASSRWWISLGQSCITVVSCLSWQSRYFSPPSMYSLHSSVWRLMILARPLPLTWPPAPLSLDPDLGPLRGSTDCRSRKRRRVVMRRMMGEERKGREASW